MSDRLPEVWREFLQKSGVPEYLWQKPLDKVNRRRTEKTVFPPEGKIFRAFELTPPEKVRVVIIGQDPYHDDGQAEGLAFSVPETVELPPSLKNIFREYASDLDREPPPNGHLSRWAENGVLLLNAVLSVDAHTPGSHADFGWEEFTDAVISALNERNSKTVFILWGNFARKKKSLISSGEHIILENVHPSPLSAYRGFFGSKPFSATEKALKNWHW
ncbi:MAG: uracil-DNA glycosylase [Lentisphaerae bacterium]|nr:uracil-DNA glycosylase [Lentisphaerota bacterium]